MYPHFTVHSEIGIGCSSGATTHDQKLCVPFSDSSKVEQVKQKQKGQERMLLPSVEGHQGGNWIVIDSGGFLVGITVTWHGFL